MAVLNANLHNHPVPEITNVVFFDSNWSNFFPGASARRRLIGGGSRQQATPTPPVVRWCRLLRKRLNDPTELSVYRLVCRGTVEDNIANKSLQRKLLGDLRRDNIGGGSRPAGPDNGSRVWKIKRQTLEDLFFNSIHSVGDNGLFNSDLKVIQVFNPNQTWHNFKITNHTVKPGLEIM